MLLEVVHRAYVGAQQDEVQLERARTTDLRLQVRRGDAASVVTVQPHCRRSNVMFVTSAERESQCCDAIYLQSCE
jgi:hypothetical protein